MANCKARAEGSFSATAQAAVMAGAMGHAIEHLREEITAQSHQNRNVARAKAITIQVKRPAQRSAMACTGALRAWACSTRAITRASADSDPGLSTLEIQRRLQIEAAGSQFITTGHAAGQRFAGEARFIQR